MTCYLQAARSLVSRMTINIKTRATSLHNRVTTLLHSLAINEPSKRQRCQIKIRINNTQKTSNYLKSDRIYNIDHMRISGIESSLGAFAILYNSIVFNSFFSFDDQCFQNFSVLFGLQPCFFGLTGGNFCRERLQPHPSPPFFAKFLNQLMVYISIKHFAVFTKFHIFGRCMNVISTRATHLFPHVKILIK